MSVSRITCILFLVLISCSSKKEDDTSGSNNGFMYDPTFLYFKDFDDYYWKGVDTLKQNLITYPFIKYKELSDTITLVLYPNENAECQVSYSKYKDYILSKYIVRDDDGYDEYNFTYIKNGIKTHFTYIGHTGDVFSASYLSSFLIEDTIKGEKYSFYELDFFVPPYPDQDYSEIINHADFISKMSKYRENDFWIIKSIDDVNNKPEEVKRYIGDFLLLNRDWSSCIGSSN